MKKKLYIYTFAALSAAIILFFTSVVQNELNSAKEEYKLTDTNVIDNAPPVVAFTCIALGSFRGLLADILWIKCITLQEQKKYFEIAQIASWISKLQPKFTGANAFLAWNMAYNISVSYTKPKEKWKWVSNGIKLLKDSLMYNPSDPLLYKELAWMYVHKIGDLFDPANQYYKYKLAMEMSRILGSAHPDWQAIAAAPSTQAGLYKHIPENDPLWEPFRKSGLKDLNEITLAFKQKGHFEPSLARDIADKEKLKYLADYIRAGWLRNDYLMNPEKIIRINAEFGDLDWRLYQSHAIYWSLEGLAINPQNQACITTLYMALKYTVTDGYLLLFVKNKYKLFTTMPRFANIDKINKYIYEKMVNDSNMNKRNFYSTFLQVSIFSLYSYGMDTKAKYYFRCLKQTIPSLPENTVEQLMQEYWMNNSLKAPESTFTQIMKNTISNAYYLILTNQTGYAEAQFSTALKLYNTYKDIFKNKTLPPFEQLKSETLDETLKKLPLKYAEKLKKNEWFMTGSEQNTKTRSL